MIKREAPPFYANRADNMSCALATYRSLIEYFTGVKWTWRELEKLQGYKKGIAAWTVKALAELATSGWDIIIIEPFDYKKYLHSGPEYLYEVFGKEAADWQVKNSNILKMKKYIPNFIKTVNHIQRSPTIHDIDTMLSEGRLVTVVLNAKKLNKKHGYAAHSVLIFDHDDENFIFHDPGLPSQSARVESKERIAAAMGKSADVTGFKRKQKNE